MIPENKPRTIIRKQGVSDPLLIRREVYNPNPFDVFFELDESKIPYLNASGITVGEKLITCKSDGFAMLNHAFYFIRTKSGAPGKLVWNYGNEIGKGNKKPSKPFVERGQ